jgi:hypothetical protein
MNIETQFSDFEKKESVFENDDIACLAGRALKPKVEGSRVTRWVCEKIAQNVAQPFFVKIKT